MAWFKTGGEVPVWQTNNPDVTSAFTLVNGTKNIAVTQKPRFILLYRTVHNAVQNNGYAVMYDVENDSCFYSGLSSNGYANGREKSGFFGTITSSNVQIVATTQTTYQYTAAIWY